ncbi:MAG: ATP-binding protein [Phycisphaerales bacterium]|nr:ATP-binding protein [Phycisphaerales bacterium]
MASPIPIPFFGRGAELAALEERCASPGLTIVKGPPRIGKTRLLTHFVERSKVAGSRRVGMAEAGEAAGDVLLRAIKDAYDHWMKDGGVVAEVRSIAAQMEGKWITTAGVAFGKALAGFGGPAKDLVKAAFAALEEAKRMAEAGGVQLTRLTSEEARDLLAVLAEGAGAPVVVVLNQWEEGQDLGKDTATLRTFLGNQGEWPACHVLLHLRDPRFPRDRNQEAGGLAAQLREFPTAGTLKIGHLDFETDTDAYDELIGWLIEHFPAFAATDGSDYLSDLALEEIGGNPAVLSEWAHASEADRASLARLGEIAADARAMRYPELRVLYRRLLDEVNADPARLPILEVAVLAAVLPLPVDAGEQASLLPAVLGAAEDHALDRLESDGLLRPEGGPRLSLGHPSRREAAARCVLGLNERQEAMDGGLAPGFKPYLRRAVARVIPALVDLHTAVAWGALDESLLPAAATLAASAGLVQAAGSGGFAAALCAAAGALFPDGAKHAALEGAAAAVAGANPAARLVVAVGLNNAIAESGADTTRADKLLGELRSLAGAHPGDAAVREQLAKGLFNAFNHSEPNSARADGLLGELRSLAGAHPGDAAVRENLARGLFNASYNSERNSARADELLGELRSLAGAHPGDAAVREQLAMGLFNAFCRSERNSARADGLLGELRSLAEAHPGEAALRERLARGLSNAIFHSGADTARADRLLGELRSLPGAHPGDAPVREALATGLFNAFHESEANSARADGLLGELRSLAEDHPGDAAVRERLATGLFNAFNNSERNSARADGLLGELRSLAGSHPGDAAVREPLAKGLNNAIFHSGADSARADGLLGELRSLSERFPGEAAVRELLATGLLNAFTLSEANSARADGFVGELRSLSEAFPGEAAFRGLLARGLGVSMYHAVGAGDVGRAAGLAEELVLLRDAVEAQPELDGLFRQTFEEAVRLAGEKGDEAARARLLAASEALFGE